MGWKASAIIINKPFQIDREKLLKDLGFLHLKRIKDKRFDEVLYVYKPNRVYIGAFEDNLIICAADLPMKLIEGKETQAERILTTTFPSSEVCSIMLISTVNFWGYAVIKNGVKIRRQAGWSG